MGPRGAHWSRRAIRGRSHWGRGKRVRQSEEGKAEPTAIISISYLCIASQLGNIHGHTDRRTTCRRTRFALGRLSLIVSTDDGRQA